MKYSGFRAFVSGNRASFPKQRKILLSTVQRMDNNE